MKSTVDEELNESFLSFLKKIYIFKSYVGMGLLKYMFWNNLPRVDRGSCRPMAY